MNALSNFYTTPFVIFTFVLARVSGLVMTAPIFGSDTVPTQVRAFLAFALALIITPVQITARLAMPANLVTYTLSLGGELLIGMVLGIGVMILMSGVQVAGQIMSQMSGMSLADVFDPGIDAEVPVMATMLNLVTIAVFVLIGGHRLLLGALLDTYSFLPLGHANLQPSLGSLIVTLFAESFSLATRCAAPAIVALMLATIVLGLISRTLPQLNILAIGFGLNAVVSFATLVLSIGAIAWLFQEQLEPAVQAIVESLHSVA
ncbi:MAG TPA: flagellar biosynthetic protein FliR [Pirellulales bacterium]|nr:flagellar biosynthetic protein FliR [Pirellulales bacterium]